MESTPVATCNSCVSPIITLIRVAGVWEGTFARGVPSGEGAAAANFELMLLDGGPLLALVLTFPVSIAAAIIAIATLASASLTFWGDLFGLPKFFTRFFFNTAVYLTWKDNS
jgi:hypothetical protein